MAVSLVACADDESNATADETVTEETEENTAFNSRLADGQDTPMIAQGVEVPPGATLFKTSGIGPSALNEDVEDDDPMAFIDPAILVDGELPDGMSVTEAQGLVALSDIRDLLLAEGLDVQDVATMRVFLAGADGEDPDFEGWNRAYRQYFANTDLNTGEPMQLARGTSEIVSDPLIINETRPTRFAIGIWRMPVDGWLVEIEVDAYKTE